MMRLRRADPLAVRTRQAESIKNWMVSDAFFYSAGCPQNDIPSKMAAFSHCAHVDSKSDSRHVGSSTNENLSLYRLT